ncbi:MAG TPA: CotH kinase family protein [Chthoniobacteraceae bacterium]|nr:CotH kinase family protein [Chthoniobacteraceae bacterium]
MRKLSTTLLILGLIAGGIYLAPYIGSPEASAQAPEPVELTKAQKQQKKADELFNGPIRSVEIQLEPAELERLKRDERNYVEASLKEGEKTYKGVALKLKGAAGSFQGVGGKPGMTLNFDKFKGSDRFHGLKKLHLNNCAQDGTYLNEKLAGEIASKAGVPASRCTHVFVKLNGRDLGVYVLKEAYTRDFLARFYEDAEGDLWDGGFCKEIEENMETDLGDPKNKTAIKELIDACREGDAAKRWERLNAILDVDRFAAFCAMEAILSHWDGYNFNRNNYRVYREPATGKISFFLHGMDQMFGDPNFAITRDFSTLGGGAMMRCPQGAKLYRAKLESIYANVLKPTDWSARVTEVGTKLRDALAEKDPKLGKDYEARIAEARSRVEQRVAGLAKQLGDLPKPFEFDQNGIAKLEKGWREENGGGAQLSKAEADGKPCLRIAAQGPCNASWRSTVQLDGGKYRFEALARSAGIAATSDGPAKGAGLRLSGGQRTNTLEGDSAWKQVSHEFETPGGNVVLVAELRATKGEVWFQSDSLRLVKVK